ncbi:hypothetical protein N0V88_000525 [Collariella sp. IMI 366227]|nr:hypothetical protein N0V88_000525 [Collariella sp. IMI 366227]
MGAPILASAAHAMPALEASHHQEPLVIPRDTKGGRRLWYSMRVIQQPERARACGSGPKSSADRRPVDPPPVVELRIYEGQTWPAAQEKDITFVYNANFFLFATLEHARILAHARGTPAPNTPPVLTGMPVSGMAYLDRPQEAGYFLFPDLSVRHEGRYKLTFNLYEETKEDKDKDKESDGESQPSILGLGPATGGSFDFRMEIRSQEFIVYSAKKFPGLAESTPLSRVVAEQGCRVRIRRDVRMRRRDPKGSTADYDNGEDEYSRRRRTATPDNRMDYNRARSMSGSTERPPYSADSQRRPSIADYPTHYPSQSSQPGGHLHFLGGSSSSQYPAAPAPPQSCPQPPSMPPSPVYPSQSVPYPAHSYAPPPAPSSRSHSRERTPSQPGYPTLNPAPPRRDSMHMHRDYRPTPVVRLPPLNLNRSHPSSDYAATHRKMQQDVASLPPLHIDPDPIYHGNAPPNRLHIPSPRDLVGSSTSISNLIHNHAPSSSSSSSSNGPTNPRHLPPPAPYAGTKRSRDQVFVPREEEKRRFQDGARDLDLTPEDTPYERMGRRGGPNLGLIFETS